MYLLPPLPKTESIRLIGALTNIKKLPLDREIGEYITILEELYPELKSK